MYRVKVGDNLFAEASAPSKKAARQLAAEEAVKELMADGKLQLNKVRQETRRITGVVHFPYWQNEWHVREMNCFVTSVTLFCSLGSVLLTAFSFFTPCARLSVPASVASGPVH